MHTPPNRRGNAMLVGLSLTTLLGFGALSVDLGVVRVSGSQLQAGLDAAAFSGVGYLNGTDDGVTEAIAQTIAFAARNEVMGNPIVLSPADITPGTWDSDAGTFTPWSGDAAEVNAIRIDHQAPDAAPALGTAAFGFVGYTIEKQATAVLPWAAGPASSTSCFLPLAIPDCHLLGVAPGTNPEPLVFSMAPSTTDSVAWADPDANPNSSEIRNQLLGQCDQGEIALGDPIYVNEGQHNTAMHTIRDILNDVSSVSPEDWDELLYGPIPEQYMHPTHGGSDVLEPRYENILQGPVALVDAGGDCSNVSFTGTLPMTGVAWAVIYDIESGGGDKHIKVQLDLVNEHDIWGDTDEDAVGLNVLGMGPPTLVNGG